MSQLVAPMVLMLLGLAARCGAATILLQTTPAGISHALQGLAIAGSLRRRGHHVVMLIADYDAEALSAKGKLADVTPVVWRAPPNSRQKVEDLLLNFQSRPREFMHLYLSHMEGQCRSLLRDTAALEALHRLKPDLYLSDNVFVCNFFVSELLQVPRVDLCVTELVDPFWSKYYGIWHSPAAHPYVASGRGVPGSFLERAANALMSHLVYLVGDTLAQASSTRLAREFNLTSSNSRAAAHRQARLLLVNAGFGVTPPRSLPPNVKMVGPLLASPAMPLPAELDSILRRAGEGGAVYASFGTAFKLKDCTLARGPAGALSSLNRTVIWNVAAHHFSDECPLDSLGLPPSVHTVPWVPQSDLVGHPAVKATVTHGGINSLYEAAYHATPLVCLGVHADQLDSCAKATSGGWGLTFQPSRLSPATAPDLAGMIERVATEASFAQAAARVAAMLRAHPRPPPEQAADWVEYALALPPDAQLRDPAVALPWWKWLCLDVYAAAAAVLLAAFIGTGLAARAAWRAVWGRSIKLKRQ